MIHTKKKKILKKATWNEFYAFPFTRYEILDKLLSILVPQFSPHPSTGDLANLT